MSDDARDADDPHFAIGFGRPPEATRFRPGTSGNPKGRPRGEKNIATLLLKELAATVVVNQNGKRKTISKRQALVTQWINAAVRGDLKALTTLLSELRLRESAAPAAQSDETPYSPHEAEVMDGFLERMKRLALQQQDDTTKSEVSTDGTGKSDDNAKS